MQPKSRKKLQFTRETLRSLTVLSRNELGRIAGGISHETLCNSKDLRCPLPSAEGTTCNDTAQPNCQSAFTCGSQVLSCSGECTG
jgi:hypothetical protein